MRAIGYLTVCATIGGILALSTPFTERRSIKTWAPNVVVAAPKPVRQTRQSDRATTGEPAPRASATSSELQARSWRRPASERRKARETTGVFRMAGSARFLQPFRRIFSINLPLASSSISLSR